MQPPWGAVKTVGWSSLFRDTPSNETAVRSFNGVYGDPDDISRRLGFSVPSLERVLEALQALGTAVVSQPKATAWGRRAVVQDPDGRAVELYQWKTVSMRP